MKETNQALIASLQGFLGKNNFIYLSRVNVAQCVFFYVVFGRPFPRYPFSLWTLYCISFELRLQNLNFVSSNFSWIYHA